MENRAVSRKPARLIIREAATRIRRDKFLWLLALPGIIYFAVFAYVPMSGLVISFMNYSPTRGIRGSQLVGFKYFIEFFSSPFFPRLLRNTVLLSLYGLLWGFPIPIIFALLLNEVKNGLFKRTVQTVSYMPYFISVVVLAGMVQSFLTPYDGAVNKIIAALGYETVNFMVQPRWFRTIYIASGIWQGFGYESIVYLAAISAVDTQMYEAARIDGATRMQIILRITLPGIAPTAIILLIMNFGRIMNIGFEKVNLLYSPAVYETADVIATYVYRRGILDGQFSFATAVGLFNSAVNLILILTVNWISKRVTEVSLW